MAERLPQATLHELLSAANLLVYERELEANGADDVNQLRSLNEEIFDNLCQVIGMKDKQLHLLRFRQALGRNVSDFISHCRFEKTASESTAIPDQQHAQSFYNDIASLNRVLINGTPPRRIQVSTNSLVQPSEVIPTAFNGATSTVSSLSTSTPLLSASLHRSGFKGSASPDNDESSSLPSDSMQSSVLAEGSVHLHDNGSKEAANDNKLYLPAYLHPNSATTDFSELVDESTPVQLSFPPSPINPQIWDPKRVEFIKCAAAIYGRKVNQRKVVTLTSHEVNINEAAAQLCLRDPTLLARRDELFTLARRAVREGGFSYVHGFSRSKQICKNQQSPVEEPSSGADNSFTGSNKSVREKRKMRLEELERLIARNKSDQKSKLIALERAKASKEFNIAYQHQVEIETLGNVLLTLETEYGQLKRRQKRSDRYFENKSKRPHQELDAVEERETPLPCGPISIGPSDDLPSLTPRGHQVLDSQHDTSAMSSSSSVDMFQHAESGLDSLITDSHELVDKFLSTPPNLPT